MESLKQKTAEQWAEELTAVVDKGTGHKYDWPEFGIIVRQIRNAALREAADCYVKDGNPELFRDRILSLIKPQP